MPRLKNYKPGKRINIWLPARQVRIAEDIDNLSNFFQLALDQAAGVMAVSIIAKEKELKHPDPSPEQLARFNQLYPQHPLTIIRKQKQCPTPPSQTTPELW